MTSTPHSAKSSTLRVATLALFARDRGDLRIEVRDGMAGASAIRGDARIRRRNVAAESKPAPCEVLVEHRSGRRFDRLSTASGWQEQTPWRISASVMLVT